MVERTVFITVRQPHPEGPEIGPLEALAYELTDEILALQDRLEHIECSIDLRPLDAAKRFVDFTNKMHELIPTTVRVISNLHSGMSRDRNLEPKLSSEVELAFLRQLQKIAKSQMSFWRIVHQVIQQAIEVAENDSKHSLDLLLSQFVGPFKRLNNCLEQIDNALAPTGISEKRSGATLPEDSSYTLPFDLPPQTYWEQRGKQIVEIISSADLRSDSSQTCRPKPRYLLGYPVPHEEFTGKSDFGVLAQNHISWMLHYLYDLEELCSECYSWSLAIEERSKTIVQEVRECWNRSLVSMVHCLKFGFQIDPSNSAMELAHEREFLEQAIQFANEQLKCRRAIADFLTSVEWLVDDEEDRECLNFRSREILKDNQKLLDLCNPMDVRHREILKELERSTRV